MRVQNNSVRPQRLSKQTQKSSNSLLMLYKIYKIIFSQSCINPNQNDKQIGNIFISNFKPGQKEVQVLRRMPSKEILQIIVIDVFCTLTEEYLYTHADSSEQIVFEITFEFDLSRQKSLPNRKERQKLKECALEVRGSRCQGENKKSILQIEHE